MMADYLLAQLRREFSMSISYPFPVFPDEFKGKRVLITGGTKGMGEATVRRFLLAGADVATVPAAVLKSLVKHPLTDKGLESFLADWKKTGQKIV